MKYILSAFFFAFMPSLFAQGIIQHSFDFKGYQLELTSMASDDAGNYLFCGSIQSDVSIAESQKDTMIWHRMNMFNDNAVNNERHAILLQTDTTFTIKEIYLVSGTFLFNVLYDKESNSFRIGASSLNYQSKDEELFGSWQMVLINLDLTKKSYRYSIVETPYSCRMHQLLLINNTLTCVGIKETGKNKEKLETPVIIEVSGTKFHKNKDIPYVSSPEVLRTTISSATASNHVLLTDVTVYESGFYFVANRLPFGQIPNLAMEVYHYNITEKGKKKSVELTFKPFTPSQRVDQLPIVTNVQEMHDGHLLISYVPKVNSNYFYLEKTTPGLELLSTITVPDLQYPDSRNELVILPNGKIVVAGLNASKTWSYFVYSEDGLLEKEIDTKMPEKMTIGFTQTFSNDDFVCLFYSYGTSTSNQLFVYSSR